MKASEKLLDTGEFLLVWATTDNKVLVQIQDAYEEDECLLIGHYGHGDDFESACDDYLNVIKNKKIVIQPFQKSGMHYLEIKGDRE